MAVEIVGQSVSQELATLLNDSFHKPFFIHLERGQHLDAWLALYQVQKGCMITIFPIEVTLLLNDKAQKIFTFLLVYSRCSGRMLFSLSSHFLLQSV